MHPILHARPTTGATDYEGVGRHIIARYPIAMDYLAQDERLSSLRGIACYLASPYTHYPYGHAAAAHAAATVVAALTRMGLSVYSPIVSGHAMCAVAPLPATDQHFWQRIDAPWVDAAQACIVATLPGWDTSRGVAHEVASFLAAGKPVIYVDPQSL